MRTLGPFLLALLFIVIGLAVVVENLRSNPFEQKAVASKAVLYYTLDDGQPLNLTLFPTDSEIRVITHLRLPDVEDYNPAQRYRYGLRFSVVTEGEQIAYAQEIWIESRQSKAEPVGGTWLKECAFSSSGDQLTDDRLTILKFPDGVVQGERPLLRVELTGIPGGRAMRPNWRDVTPMERELLLESEWERIAASGISGVDYQLYRAYLTSFRLPEEEAPPADGRWLGAGQGTVLNLRGPAEVRFYLQPTAPRPTFDQTREGIEPTPFPLPYRATLRLTARFAGGARTDRLLDALLTDANPREAGLFDLPAGQTVSITLLNAASYPVLLLPVLTVGGEGNLLGTPRLTPTPPGLPSGRVIGEDARYYEVVRCLPGRDSTFTVASGQAGEMLRLNVQPVFEPKEERTAYTLRVTANDLETGRLLFSGTIVGDSVASPFEEFPYDDPAVLRRPGEPQTSYLRLSRGVVRLSVRSDRPVDLLIQSATRLYIEEPRDPAYAIDPLPYLWRFEAPLVSQWLALRPDDEERLIREDRMLSVKALPRFVDPPPPPPPDRQKTYAAVAPLETAPISSLLEQSRTDSYLLHPWEFTSYTEIRPGFHGRVNVPESYLGRPPLLRWDCSDDMELGQAATLGIDDAEPKEIRIRSRHGETPLRMEKGVRRMTLNAPSACRYFVNLPVEGGSPVENHYDQRTLYRLERGERLTFPLRHPGGVKRSINVLVVRPMSGPHVGILSAVIDQGAPRLAAWALSSGLTPPRKEAPLEAMPPSRSILAVEPKAVIGAAQSFFVTLFEDASAGPHELTLTYQGAEGHVWVRVFVTDDYPVQGQGFTLWRGGRR